MVPIPVSSEEEGEEEPPEDTPAIDAIQEWYRDSGLDLALGREQGRAIALYASFLGLGISLGALMTVRLLMDGLDPAQISPAPGAGEFVLRVSTAEIRGALGTVVVMGSIGFVAGHAIVLAEVFFGDEGGDESGNGSVEHDRRGMSDAEWQVSDATRRLEDLEDELARDGDEELRERITDIRADLVDGMVQQKFEEVGEG